MADPTQGVEELDADTDLEEESEEQDRPSSIEEVLGLVPKKHNGGHSRKGALPPPTIKEAEGDMPRPPPPPSIAAKARPPESLPAATAPRPEGQGPGGHAMSASPQVSRPPRRVNGLVRQAQPLAAMPPPPAAAVLAPSRSILGLLLGILMVLSALLVLLVADRVGTGQGTLVVTVAGPETQPVEGVMVSVDGKPACDRSPCTVDGLSEGPHLVGAKAEGFPRTADQAIVVVAGKHVAHNFLLAQASKPEAEPQELTATRFIIRAGAGTEGAEVTLDGKSISLPHTVDVAQAASLTLKAEKPGYEDHQSQLEFDPGSPEKSIDITLLPETEASAPEREESKVVTPVAQPSEVASPSPAVKTEAATSPAPAAAPKEAAPATPEASTEGVAKLNLTSSPSATVVLNGRPLGRTPKLGVTAKVGMNRITFIHADHGRKDQHVSVQAGGTKTVAVTFP